MYSIPPKKPINMPGYPMKHISHGSPEKINLPTASQVNAPTAAQKSM